MKIEYFCNREHKTAQAFGSLVANQSLSCIFQVIGAFRRTVLGKVPFPRVTGRVRTYTKYRTRALWDVSAGV